MFNQSSVVDVSKVSTWPVLTLKRRSSQSILKLLVAVYQTESVETFRVQKRFKSTEVLVEENIARTFITRQKFTQWN